MGGVVIGTAITQYRSPSKAPRAVALTINNSCNLKCDHCYLQYAKRDRLITMELVHRILSQPFEHLAIVGMEPLVDRAAALRTEEIVLAAKCSGKSVSLITNGLNLNLLPAEAAQALSYIDVSFDGGPATYPRNRGASFDRLNRNVQAAAKHVAVNALHTLYAENLLDVEDMLAGTASLPISREMFSPYVSTRNQGENSVTSVPIREILVRLSRCEQFASRKRSFLLLDQYHLDTERMSSRDATSLAEEYGILDQASVVPSTPLQVGTLRATYDGLLLSPADALHTAAYHATSLDAWSVSLGNAYKAFVGLEKANATGQRRLFDVRSAECSLPA